MHAANLQHKHWKCVANYTTRDMVLVKWIFDANVVLKLWDHNIDMQVSMTGGQICWILVECNWIQVFSVGEVWINGFLLPGIEYFIETIIKSINKHSLHMHRKKWRTILYAFVNHLSKWFLKKTTGDVEQKYSINVNGIVNRISDIGSWTSISNIKAISLITIWLLLSGRLRV